MKPRLVPLRNKCCDTLAAVFHVEREALILELREWEVAAAAKGIHSDISEIEIIEGLISHYEECINNPHCSTITKVLQAHKTLPETEAQYVNTSFRDYVELDV